MTQETTADKAAAPAPTFDAIALGADIRKAVDALGYVNPTPVQLAVFESASRGKSLVVQARTGTGKTAAFGLPIVDALVRKSQASVQALILTPTRELALQVSRELEQLSQFRGTKIIAIYGGAPMGRQVEALEQGAQIVCGTPGRVLDHIRRGTLKTEDIRIFVLDEADEMLSMGFQKELNSIIETLPKDRQGLYFSATLPPDVERLANNHLKDPEWITLSSDQIGALELTHYVYLVREGDKRSALNRIIEVEDPQSAIVFCNTKSETESLAESLKRAGYEADWLNGDLEQRERERVMAATREGKLRFLVATDVAARGIDISHLTHVINADFPESAEQYVHRTGRTGRAGRTGTAISIVGPKDVGHLYMLRLTYKIRPIERMLPTAGELRTRAEADMIAFLADAYAGKTADAQHLAVARRLLTDDRAEVVIAGLLADHLGASAPQDAADARRAKNPPPIVPHPAPAPAPQIRERTDRPARSDREPRTLRDGERPARGRDRDRDRDRGPRPATAEPSEVRRERRPVKELSSWEPPEEKDDDAPLFDEAGTKPGLGPSGREALRDQRERGRDRGRGRARVQVDEDAGADAKTIEMNRPLPAYHIEDEPTIAFTGRLPKPRAEEEPASRSERSERAERSEHQEPREGDDPAFTNVFLNVGRRDGLSQDDLQRLVTEKAGLGDADVGHVRLRDRISFVGIRKERADDAIKALIGVNVGDRVLNAEVARGR
ncbi:MAG: DEAD/DEAH box helicase [Labilithrix sp.]|nr:DEAD/DEAH box helicase [Labilithrix sp.]MCW5813901.1 DEAD/DEAH box helicase [Labilithrix sp.]